MPKNNFMSNESKHSEIFDNSSSSCRLIGLGESSATFGILPF